MRPRVAITVSIRIVADCVALSCQVTRMLKQATTLKPACLPAGLLLSRLLFLYIVMVALLVFII